VIIFLAALLFAASVEAATPYRDWKFRGDVLVPKEKYVAVPLSPRDLERCDKPECSDLRLVDMNGAEVPYAIVFEGERRTETDLTGREINRESPSAGTSRLTIDFGSSLPKDRITVETSGDSFRRRAKVEGRDDLQNWVTLQPEAWLIAAGASRERRFESVEIGLNTYRYLRVTVSAMAEESETPRIERVGCKNIVVRPAREVPTAAAILSYSVDPKEGSTLDLDFGLRHLPIQRLRLMVTKPPDRLFRKNCTVLGRDTLQHSERVRFETGELGRERMVESPWARVGSGAVYRDADGRESMEIAVPVSFRYVRVRIEEGDSPPLELRGVEGMLIPAYIVLEPAGQTRFQVFAGSAEAPGVHYQFGPVLASLDSRELRKSEPIRFEAQVAPRTGGPPPGQSLVWVVLALAVGVTTWMLWFTARRLGDEAGPDAGDAPPGVNNPR
jgi:hypothetical protein